MKPVTSATLVANRGLLGSADQNGRRQVTIISQERWKEVERQLGSGVDPAFRRANLMISGIDLVNSRVMDLQDAVPGNEMLPRLG